MELIKKNYILILLVIAILVILILNILSIFKTTTCTYYIKESNYSLNINIKISLKEMIITKEYISDSNDILESELKLNSSYQTKIENNKLLATKKEKITKTLQEIKKLKKIGFVCH